MNLALVYGVVLVVHVLVALFLIAVILLQGGRGGLGEALGGSAAQSLFGGGANTVMTRITAVGAALFMVTCLSLAALSTAQGRSVVDQLPVAPGQLPLTDQLPLAPSQAPEHSPHPLESEVATEAVPPSTSTSPHPGDGAAPPDATP